MKIRGRSFGMIGLLVASLSVPACSMDAPEPISSELPGSAPQATLTATAPEWTPSGRWQRWSAKCPTLTTELTGLPGLVGEGLPNDSYLDLPVGLSGSCRWEGSGTDGKPAVQASFALFRHEGSKTVEQSAIDTFQKARDNAHEEALDNPERYGPPQDVPGLGDEAYLTMSAQRMSLSLKVRSENAVLTTTIWLENDWDYDDKRRTTLVREQRPNVIAVMKDVLDDLR